MKLTNLKQIPSSDFIIELEKHIKSNVPEVNPPDWSLFNKTGRGRISLPNNKYWWYTRAASLLRKIYLNEPIGTQKLRSHYGTRMDNGHRPEKHVDGGGSNIRKITQQLSQAGLIEKTKKGCMLTSSGRSLLDGLSSQMSRKTNLKKWYE